MLALGLQGLFFFILTLILDGVKRPAASLPPSRRQAHKAGMVSSEDDDVARERERVAGGSLGDMLVVQALSKVYNQGWFSSSHKKVAVDNITFGVPDGEVSADLVVKEHYFLFCV